MAKRKNIKKSSKKDIVEQFDNMLPQNILPIGEKVEEDKRIYISQKVYKEIHKFTKDKTTNESGGMLIGTVIEEFGETNIAINGFIEAKYSEGTPTTLKFTHETWDYVHKEMERKYQTQKIVGWIHTHPDFGIFLSEYDKFIQENFFKEDSQIAYVVDPIQGIEGFYFWINGRIERCKGFYIFDKTGVKITIDTGHEEDDVQRAEPSPFSFKNILLGILSAAIVILLIMNISLNNKVKEIDSQQRTLTDSANTSLYMMQQQIAALSSKIDELTKENDTVEDDNNSPEPESKGGEKNNPSESSTATEPSKDTSAEDTTNDSETSEPEKDGGEIGNE